MSERDSIVETVTQLFWYVDQRQWDHLTDLFADQVRLDYTSLTGGQPSTVTPDEVIARLKAGLGRLDATQHLVTNQLVDFEGDTAEVSANSSPPTG